MYNIKKTARYIPYKKVSEEVVRHIKTELKKIYNNEDGVADGIAIEHGNDVYIVDSGRENGSTTFGIRRRRRISNAKLRAEFIRSTNNDAVSKRFVSDEISSRVGNGLGGDSGRNMRRESRTELQTDSRESQDNQSGVLGENADNGGVKFALKDTESTYTEEQYNRFGWASEAGGITSSELDDLYSKIQARTTLRTFKQSSRGEAIIEVNKKPHTTLDVDNVFVFVKGTKNNFHITRTVRFNVETETEMEILREDLYEGRTCNDTHIALYQEKGLAREYRREDFPAFAEYSAERSTRRTSNGETSRGTYQDNRGRAEYRSGHTHKTERIRGSGSEFLKVVHTFIDISGKKRNVLKVDTEYMIEGDARSKYQPSVEAAVKAENERIIRRYANNLNRTRSWVKSKLETEPNFLINERKRGFRFNLVDDPTAKPYFYELTDGQVKKLLANSTKMTLDEEIPMVQIPEEDWVAMAQTIAEIKAAITALTTATKELTAATKEQRKAMRELGIKRRKA